MYNGTWDTIKKIYHNERYKSLYKGFWISYACYAPYLALSYTLYEYIRSLYHPSVSLEYQPS